MYRGGILETYQHEESVIWRKLELGSTAFIPTYIPSHQTSAWVWGLQQYVYTAYIHTVAIYAFMYVCMYTGHQLRVHYPCPCSKAFPSIMYSTPHITQTQPHTHVHTVHAYLVPYVPVDAVTMQRKDAIGRRWLFFIPANSRICLWWRSRVGS